MLLFKNRLKKKNDFQRIFSDGRVVNSEFMLLRLLENEKDESRVGIVVSKKIFKKATLRNKIKRRLREQMRSRISKVRSGLDIIITAKVGIDKKNFQEIGDYIDKLLLKAKIYD